jgi:hypothetical protein
MNTEFYFIVYAYLAIRILLLVGLGYLIYIELKKVKKKRKG